MENNTALNGIKMMIADGIVTQEAAEKYFPKLKESEDEKMRKSIIYALRNGGFYDNDKTDEAIAWLEKQGEQKADDKAKRYDDLLVKLQEAKVNNDVCDERYCCVIDDIVPELKENEDERIRNALIRFHKSTIDVDGIKGEDILAWLEKQGEQKETPCDKCKKEQPSHSCQDITELGRCALEMQDSQNLANSTKTCEDEQKPTDKVEPKFHKGEWITNGIETVQITGYDIDYGYQVDYKGNLQHRDTDVIEKEYHLWTIQDAKTGDVLIDDIGVILFRKIGNEKYENAVDYHCVVYTDGKFEKQEGLSYWGLSTYAVFHPATKVQRERFFARMHEAGYEWDAEKKELKELREE